MTNTVGKRLKWARETAGLSLAQAEALLGIGPNLLKLVEEDVLIAGEDRIEKMSYLYDIREEWLLTGVDVALTGDAHYKVTGDVDPAEMERMRTLISRLRQVGK
jgi:transcriptional regulator with XRE-family HTH domain